MQRLPIFRFTSTQLKIAEINKTISATQASRSFVRITTTSIAALQTSKILMPVSLRYDIQCRHTSYFQRLKNLIRTPEFDASVLKYAAVQMYVTIVDYVEYDAIFKNCKMPDHFISWFFVTILHIWMILVRLQREKDIGRAIRQQLSKHMWLDFEKRLSLLGVVSRSKRDEQTEFLSAVFNAAVLSFDGGLLGDDKQLASALWQFIFSQDPDFPPEGLERMVAYVRCQVQYMDNVNRYNFLTRGEYKWIPFSMVKCQNLL